MQGSNNTEVEEIVINGLKVDFPSYEITIDDNNINLTFKEFELLKFFVKNQKRVLKREELITQVWGLSFLGKTRTIDVHVRRLRFKLGKYGSMIKTVRKVGYKFVPLPV